ncbi:hypothetical protein IT575_08790 [bacterium]|nr:hypothetical protein [bacterium]
MRGTALTAFVLLLVLGSLLCSSSPVDAAEGRQARFAISMQIGEDFFKLLRKQLKAQPGANSDEMQMLDEVLIPGSFSIPSVTGVLYYSGQTMRMDMTLPGEEIATMLIDSKAGRMYLIDHKLKKAEYANLKDFASQQLGAGGMLLNPEMAALDWGEFMKQLNETPQLKSRQLGSRTVNGLSCQGVELSSTMGALTDAEELAAVPSLPALIDPKTTWKGTVWMSDGVPVPVKFSSEMMGLSCIWQLLELSSWKGSDAFLTVPPGYKTSPLDMSMFSGALSSGMDS